LLSREARDAVLLGAPADRGSRAHRLQTTHMEAAEVRPEQTPNGAHMDIGAHGDLSTLHWVQSEPSPHADFLSCEVTYGAAAASPVAWRADVCRGPSQCMPVTAPGDAGARQGTGRRIEACVSDTRSMRRAACRPCIEQDDAFAKTLGT